MIQYKTILISTLAASLVLLAGCTAQTATNTNTVSNSNEVDQNTNAEVVANTNETVTNENTNTEQGSEVDTSDWLTYTNDEYGFSFRYPKELFANHVSEASFPFSRTKISEAPTERLEDHFENTKGELNAEKIEITDAVVDNKFYKLLPSGIKVKTKISQAEGEALIKVFTWYDEEYQYSFTFVFPSLAATPKEFFTKYDSNEKVTKFIEKIWEGSAEKKYQEEFDLYDSIMDTLIKAK